ncbi:MAG: serine/threonine protein kinase [Candidatus Eisenbacteria bacterium]|nr:serine/threonine protein kinase [Candidatus Eisenbacteria bacterium]
MTQQALPEWERIRRTFEEAESLPSEERTAFLDRACPGQPGLRAEVESLLAAHERVTGQDLLASPFAAPSAAEEREFEAARIGTVVGSYRLCEVVGRGGMGLVHRAEHVDPRMTQRVAVKCLRRDFRPDDLRRFREEQRILARLEHPNIARLLDAGVAEDGMPFLILEYVDGMPLTEYARAHGLTTSQRIELFETVCAAVQAAHESLIVHRDLKPSNILVGRDGRPRLLDFGIAKLLEEGSGEPAALTRTGQHVLTPEYASPEQYRGETASTRSDVYSLGVVLYELLSGRRPHDLAGLTAAQAERVVCEETPRPPRAAGTGRELADDLVLITMTALSKDGARRYASVAQLAEDLRRHRGGLPILARPDTLTYRTGKFVARNRGAIAAAALVALALVAGVVATARQAAQTERRFEQVRALANTLLVDIQDEIRDQPGMTTFRRKLVERATAHLDGLSGDTRDDPALRAELAAAYEKLGELEGDPQFASLGNLAGAIARYRHADSLRALLLAEAPADPARRRARASTSARLAMALSWNGDNDSAMVLAGRALAELAALSRALPGDPVLRAHSARVRSELGWYRIWAGQAEPGMEDTRVAAAALDSLLARSPDELELSLARADCAIYRSDGLKFAARYANVVEELEPQIARLERLGRDHPLHVRLHRKRLGCLKQLGEALEWLDPPRALRTYEEAIRVSREQVLVDGDNFSTRRNLASSYSHLGGLLLDQRRYEPALVALSEASEAQRWLFEQDAQNHSDGSNLATSLMWMGQASAKLSRHERAIELAAAAVRVRESMLARLTGDAANLGNLSSARGALGEAYRGRAEDPRTARQQAGADRARAAAEYRAAIEGWERLEKEGRRMEFWASSIANCRRGLAAVESRTR